jgi:GNAT superfamily N-acetyltransferase
MNITNAVHGDLLTLVELGAHMSQESPHYRQWPVNGEKIHNLIGWLIDSDDGIVIVARDEQTDDVIGGFVGGVEKMWCNDEKAMYDFALFIAPSHRGGSLAVRLMKEAFSQAKQKGAVTALLSNSTGVASDRVERLFQHMGMNRLGGLYAIGL